MRIFVTVLCLFALIFQVKADERKKTYEKKISKCELEELTINNKHGKIEVVQHDQEALEIVAEMKVVAKTAAKADEALELIQVVEGTESVICLIRKHSFTVEQCGIQADKPCIVYHEHINAVHVLQSKHSSFNLCTMMSSPFFTGERIPFVKMHFDITVAVATKLFYKPL